MSLECAVILERYSEITQHKNLTGHFRLDKDF